MKPISFRVIPPDVPNEGILFVDRRQDGRSGHGGNCLTQCANGDILSFCSNVSGSEHRGHGIGGWSEIRRSTDGGTTWSTPVPLDYSLSAWEGSEIHSALVFAAITAVDGTVVAFLIRFARDLWIKQDVPVVLLSHDHGYTWTEPVSLDASASVEEVSMTLDAVFMSEGEIHALFMGGSDNFCPGPFTLYTSSDNGRSFARRSTLPFPHQNYYITGGILPGGDIIAYSYPYRPQAEIDEFHLDYAISRDGGHTWPETGKSRFARRIRNPQMSARLAGRYYLQGRAGSQGTNARHLVLYTSEDGVRWDEGLILRHNPSDIGIDAYSGNAIIRDRDQPDSARLLIQASVAYDPESWAVNSHHWWVVP